MDVVQYIFGAFLAVASVIFPYLVAGFRRADQRYGGGWAFLTVIAAIVVGILLCGIKSYFTYGILSAVMAALPVLLLGIILFCLAAMSDCGGIIIMTLLIDLALFIWLLVETFGEYAMYFPG
ncbi:MAG: hypothetical protein IKK43_02920 [Clostridia bacterium]|nr:hypothetical protein [Clostridia bacterium]